MTPVVIVLAGDRGPDDPLAAAAGVPGKVLVAIDGVSLLARVLDTVARFVPGARVLVVCPDHPAYRAELDQPRGLRCEAVAPAAGPAASVLRALHQVDPQAPVLLLTGDHPLIEPAWLHALRDGAERTAADAAVGVADFAAVRQAFPGSRRTRYRFADRGICGTNLFWFRTARGRRVIDAWRAFESDRKRPWRIVGRLGGITLVRYLLGVLTLDGATRALSRRLDARLVAVPIDAPEAAVDVDTPADLALVRKILAARTDRRR